MCIHEYYIFAQCGHHFFVPAPLLPCLKSLLHTTSDESKSTSKIRREDKHARRLSNDLHSSVVSSSTDVAASAPLTIVPACTPRAHPYRTHIINTGLCLHCEESRSRALRSASENLSIISVTERKWRVKYDNPAKAWSNTVLAGDGNDGGWAQGDEIDVNGYVKREEEKKERRWKREWKTSSEASQATTDGGGGGPAMSPTCWKTAHSASGNVGDGKLRSWGTMISGRGR